MEDMELLKVLENDPRATISDLADILNESEEEVVKTKARLEHDRIICGYHTVINWDKTNTDRITAIIEVSAKPERDTGYDTVAEKIGRFSEVTSLYLMSGKSEFMVFIEGQTMREVSDFVATKLAPIEGVTSTVTCFLLKQYKVEGFIMDADKVEDERMIVEP
ncbi:MAG: Lrp/AsnC family transcriptional regulator [Solobacterium sp.]|jgi:DNA-binding Lrp family transcriptional regulator|nr:Lrp/AsnC family transcriptional regulator [Solobacterium sp.]